MTALKYLSTMVVGAHQTRIGGVMGWRVIGKQPEKSGDDNKQIKLRNKI
jgi:hypothetical protein